MLEWTRPYGALEPGFGARQLCLSQHPGLQWAAAGRCWTTDFVASDNRLGSDSRMNRDEISDLPIYEILEELALRLRDGNELVLQAPPGAGKTTVVPLALLDQPWLAGRKILVLEPRRVAARAAASRMAQLLGESVGQTIGYRVRLDTCVSERTRVEVITEGILTRQLQRDPELEDVGLVIFDEFHERNLDSDLCLALALQGRELFREAAPLKLLVMSATLDGDAVAALMGGAQVLTSQGRQFPVETRYGQAYRLTDPIARPTVQGVLHVLGEHSGSVLVFLPGQREINQVARELAAALKRAGEATAGAEIPDGTPLMDDPRVHNVVDGFTEAMDDDFNTAKAVARIGEAMRLVNELCDMKAKSIKKIEGGRVERVARDTRPTFRPVGQVRKKPGDRPRSGGQGPGSRDYDHE